LLAPNNLQLSQFPPPLAPIKLEHAENVGRNCGFAYSALALLRDGDVGALWHLLPFQMRLTGYRSISTNGFLPEANA
jgi:hypothetical protein